MGEASTTLDGILRDFRSAGGYFLRIGLPGIVFVSCVVVRDWSNDDRIAEVANRLNGVTWPSTMLLLLACLVAGILINRITVVVHCCLILPIQRCCGMLDTYSIHEVLVERVKRELSLDVPVKRLTPPRVVQALINQLLTTEVSDSERSDDWFMSSNAYATYGTAVALVLAYIERGSASRDCFDWSRGWPLLATGFLMVVVGTLSDSFWGDAREAEVMSENQEAYKALILRRIEADGWKELRNRGPNAGNSA